MQGSDVLALITNEGLWLTLSMSLAAVAIAALWYTHRGPACTVADRVTAAMNLGAGVMVGTMAFGHLLAVIVKLYLGTLREGSLLVFFAIGMSLLIPSGFVIQHTGALLAQRATPNQTVMVNGWLAATLLMMGLHNLPLAAPSLFTISHRLRRRPLERWAIVAAASIVMAGLFVASLVFLASGQSFEQFSGLE